MLHRVIREDPHLGDVDIVVYRPICSAHRAGSVLVDRGLGSADAVSLEVCNLPCVAVRREAEHDLHEGRSVRHEKVGFETYLVRRELGVYPGLYRARDGELVARGCAGRVEGLHEGTS